MANTLRRKLLFVAAEELEALALSDLRMEAIGFSPLTGENLMLDETEFDFVSVRRSLEVEFCDTNCDTSSVGCGGELSSPTSRLVEGRLASLVSALPPASLPRAKASLLLASAISKVFMVLVMPFHPWVLANKSGAVIGVPMQRRRKFGLLKCCCSRQRVF